MLRTNMNKHTRAMYRGIATVVLTAFLTTSIIPPQKIYAQSLNLPEPGTMVKMTSQYMPAVIKGIKVDPNNPLAFNFLINPGQESMTREQKEMEYNKLIKYFLASLTTPEKDMWVNLSPYEHNRMISNNFGATEMGRDMLAQDYILKQLTASLVYPEDSLGKKFWNRIYERVRLQSGKAEIPVNTFNKVWIIPQSATVFEKGNVVMLVDSHLKVLMEEDYLSMKKSSDRHYFSKEPTDKKVVPVTTLASQTVREIVLPAIEQEVNQGKNFAQLRQMYNSMILASWFKQRLKMHLLSKVYVNKDANAGVLLDDPKDNERVYQDYVKAFKKGVYNYIKEEPDAATGQMVPRKYFSGGLTYESLARPIDSAMAVIKTKNTYDLSVLEETSELVNVKINIAPKKVRVFQYAPEVAEVLKLKSVQIALKNYFSSISEPEAVALLNTTNDIVNLLNNETANIDDKNLKIQIGELAVEMAANAESTDDLQTQQQIRSLTALLSQLNPNQEEVRQEVEIIFDKIQAVLSRVDENILGARIHRLLTQQRQIKADLDELANTRVRARNKYIYKNLSYQGLTAKTQNKLTMVNDELRQIRTQHPKIYEIGTLQYELQSLEKMMKEAESNVKIDRVLLQQRFERTQRQLNELQFGPEREPQRQIVNGSPESDFPSSEPGAFVPRVEPAPSTGSEPSIKETPSKQEPKTIIKSNLFNELFFTNENQTSDAESTDENQESDFQIKNENQKSTIELKREILSLRTEDLQNLAFEEEGNYSNQIQTVKNYWIVENILGKKFYRGEGFDAAVAKITAEEYRALHSFMRTKNSEGTFISRILFNTSEHVIFGDLLRALRKKFPNEKFSNETVIITPVKNIIPLPIPEVKTKANPEPTTEVNSEPKAEGKLESNTEAKPEPKTEPVEPTATATEANKPAAKPKPTTTEAGPTTLKAKPATTEPKPAPKTEPKTTVTPNSANELAKDLERAIPPSYNSDTKWNILRYTLAITAVVAALGVLGQDILKAIREDNNERNIREMSQRVSVPEVVSLPQVRQIQPDVVTALAPVITPAPAVVENKPIEQPKVEAPVVTTPTVTPVVIAPAPVAAPKPVIAEQNEPASVPGYTKGEVAEILKQEKGIVETANLKRISAQLKKINFPTTPQPITNAPLTIAKTPSITTNVPIANIQSRISDDEEAALLDILNQIKLKVINRDQLNQSVKDAYLKVRNSEVRKLLNETSFTLVNYQRNKKINVGKYAFDDFNTLKGKYVDLLRPSLTSGVYYKNYDPFKKLTISFNKGGIDFNADYLQLNMKGDGINIPVPQGFEWMLNAAIPGFIPQILDIQSGLGFQLSFFKGLLTPEQENHAKAQSLMHLASLCDHKYIMKQWLDA